MVQANFVPEMIPKLVDNTGGIPCSKAYFYFYVQILMVRPSLNF
jgi:hypothetical protein